MRGGFWRYFDFWLLGAVTILVIIGITMIRSALAGNIELTVTTPLVSRQIIFALIGFALLLAAAGVDYRLWSSMSNTLYIGIIIVLIALNVIGAALFGSARWFRTTLVFIQPSEFAKLVIILSLSHFFVRHMHEMNEPKWTLRSLIMAMGITVWVILQPNLSTSIVLLVLWFILLWMAGVPMKHLAAYAIIAIIILSIAFPILIQFQIIQDYQVKRIQQALISIGSGGLFGQGYGHGTQVQLRFLKVRWSDFIFSTSANELGFVGAVLIIVLTVFIVWRCLYAARVSRDTYGALISYGVATLIAFQAIVNIGVNLNLMPATGLTLHFVSYGGSSLVANMIAVGLVESVIMRHKALEL